jgi:hypothetical protein
MFGTVEVDAPRIEPCGCTDMFADIPSSPLLQLLPSRSTPEFQRLQADLGARHSFRE